MKIETDNNLIKRGSLEISDWHVIKLIGNENKVKDFLQGQLTSDVGQMQNNSSHLSSICDHKGQVIADFILHKKKKIFSVIINEGLVDTFQKELKIFAKFESVEFEISKEKVVGEIADKNDSKPCYCSNDKFQLNIMLKEPDFISENTISLNQWYAAHKILGIYLLDISESKKYRPIEINYDKLRVSFEKGCFRGQEIVARMHYLGINRRQFCTFIVHNDFLESPLVKIIGKTINIDNKKIFNAIIKRDDIKDISKIQKIIAIL